MIGTKHNTEAVDQHDIFGCPLMVGERSCLHRSGTVRSRGASASDNAGMSNDKAGENPARRKPKVSWGR